jgi:uncharacterized membrane protein YbhN (UPF0104 family)
MFQTLQSIYKEKILNRYNRKWMLSVILFFTLFLVAIFIVPWKETWQTLVSTDFLFLGLAYILTIPNQILVAASYYVVVMRQNVSFKFWAIFKINLIMIFYDVVLPSSILVSGLRWHRYNKFSGKPSQTLTSIAFLKVFDILITLLFSFGLMLFYKTSTFREHTFGIIVLIILITLILYFTPKLCEYLLIKIPSPVEVKTKKITKDLLLLYFHKGIFAFANFQSLNFMAQLYLISFGILSQVIHYLGYILFAESVGIHLSFSQLGAIRAIILIATSIPINFGVGISLREISLVSLLVAIDVPLEKAVAMSIVMLSKSFFYGGIGGLIEGVQLIKEKNRDNG